MSNSDTSCFWEGLIHAAVKDGSLCFLFDNKGTLYHGKGFEMLMALDQYCHPGIDASAFTTLMSLFNNSPGKNEPIMEFCSWFNGLVMEMSCCKIMLPPILLMMLFLCALHGCHADLLDQFHSCFKVLETATIDSVVEGVRYQDSFTLAGSKRSPPPPGSCIPKSSAVYVDKQGKD